MEIPALYLENNDTWQQNQQAIKHSVSFKPRAQNIDVIVGKIINQELLLEIRDIFSKLDRPLVHWQLAYETYATNFTSV